MYLRKNNARKFCQFKKCMYFCCVKITQITKTNSKSNAIMSIQTIEGCNETLNTIRKTAAEDAETA